MMTCNEVPVAVATWLSKGENLDLIYTNPKNHIVCFIPTYEPGGGDSTMCYFAGWYELADVPILDDHLRNSTSCCPRRQVHRQE